MDEREKISRENSSADKFVYLCVLLSPYANNRMVWLPRNVQWAREGSGSSVWGVCEAVRWCLRGFLTFLYLKTLKWILRGLKLLKEWKIHSKID